MFYGLKSLDPRTLLDSSKVEVLSELTGYSKSQVSRMLKDIEGKKEMEQKLKENLSKLQEEGLIDESYRFTEKGLRVAIEELVKLGKYKWGEKLGKGLDKEVVGYKPYSLSDSLTRIDIHATLREIARRKKLDTLAIKMKQEEPRAGKEILILLDASGSMKGEKFEKAVNIAMNLAIDLVKKNQRVGIIVFNDKIVKEVKPTKSLSLIEEALLVEPKGKTNLSVALKRALELLGPDSEVVIITDAIPTDESVEEVIETAKQLALKKVKVHVIGINLKEGKEIAEKIAKISSGTLQEF